MKFSKAMYALRSGEMPAWAHDVDMCKCVVTKKNEYGRILEVQAKGRSGYNYILKPEWCIADDAIIVPVPVSKFTIERLQDLERKRYESDELGFDYDNPVDISEAITQAVEDWWDD